MCLAIPMKIVKIDGPMAVAEANGVQTLVNISLMPGVKLNERVIVHAGFIIERLDDSEADAIEQTWKEYMDTLEKEKPLNI
jgi:hydrogenase expression/formation protein HypC